jgi:hypothetical protein
MAISYSMTVDGQTLHVRAQGYDEDLDDVLHYGAAVIEAAVAHGVRHVLCNEIDLEYRLSTMDIYASAEYIAERAASVARVAIVCSARDAFDAHFWETVAVNRGLTVRMFALEDVARAWLAQA